VRRARRMVLLGSASITVALLVGPPATASDRRQLRVDDVKSHKLLSGETDAPVLATACIPRCPAEPRPVPMPEVTPVQPGPVPIPRVEPSKPGPIPMPMADRPSDSLRSLRGHTPRLAPGPGGL
jgi:hypothetical protein